MSSAQYAFVGIVTVALLGAIGGAVAVLWRDIRRGDQAESKVATFEREIMELREDMGRLKEKIDVLYTEKHALIGQVEQLRIQNAHAETQIQELRKQNGELREMNARLAEELQEWKGNMQL